MFLGQWVVGARTLMPRLAGTNGLPYRRFAIWHTPAAVLWAAWTVGASYLAGASYDLVVARAGRAAGALLVLAAMIAALIVAGRWMGRLRRPWLLSIALLIAFGTLLVLVIPMIVRRSGLTSADVAITNWARGEWTSDGYRFALSTARLGSPRRRPATPPNWPPRPGCWPGSWPPGARAGGASRSGRSRRPP